jgi:hypothetical protein
LNLEDQWESRSGDWVEDTESTLPKFPKPGQVMKPQVAVKVYTDGREVCNTKYRDGQEEYISRKRKMWERQNKICCLAHVCPSCTGRMRWADTTFEHEEGRGAFGSKRDDRIEVPILNNGQPVMGEDGKPKMRRINGASHHWCNAWKGSRPIKYNAEEGG